MQLDYIYYIKTQLKPYLEEDVLDGVLNQIYIDFKCNKISPKVSEKVLHMLCEKNRWFWAPSIRI